MAVQTSDAMMNKRVKLLDGTRTKIVKVLSTSYSTESGDKIPARKLMQKGKSFVETDLTMRDLEDTGAGYVVAADSGSTKTTKKSSTKKKTTRSSGTKQSKSSGKKTSSSRRRKAKAEDEADEKPTRSRRRKSTKAKDEKPARKSRSKKKEEAAAVEEMADLPALTFEGEQPLRGIRQEIEVVISDMLNERYSNISAVISEDIRSDENPETAAMTFQVAIERPMPKHHSMEYYIEIAREAGAKPEAKLNESVKTRFCTALDIDVTEMPDPGFVLVDEEGNRFVYGGPDTVNKCFVFVSVEDEQVTVQTLQELRANTAEFLDGLDVFGDFRAVMGDSIEDVEQTNTEVDLDDSLDFDEDQRIAIKDLDWDNLDENTARELLSGNYTREELEKFAVEELEAGEDELAYTDSQLIDGIVAALYSDDEDFEEEDDMEADGDMEADVNDLDSKVNALIEAGVITEAMRSILNEDQVNQMFAEQFGDTEEEVMDEEEDAAPALTVDAMREAMVASGLPEKTVSIFQDAQVIEWYQQNVDDSAVVAEEADEDDAGGLDDEDMVELEEADEEMMEDDGMTEAADVDPDSLEDEDFDLDDE
jgi:hypothetical protein